MTEFILAIIAAIIPILWVHLINKLKKVTEDNDLLQSLVLYGSKEIQDLYQSVLARVQELAKDGEISENDRNEIILFARVEAKKHGVKLFEILSPKIYEAILQRMVNQALGK